MMKMTMWMTMREQMTALLDGLNSQGKIKLIQDINTPCSIQQTTVPWVGQPILPHWECQSRCRYNSQVLEGEEAC